MCEGGHGRPGPSGSFFKLALQPGLPLRERAREITVNLARRLRGRRLNDCCGRYGEPGC